MQPVAISAEQLGIEELRVRGWRQSAVKSRNMPEELWKEARVAAKRRGVPGDAGAGGEVLRCDRRPAGLRVQLLELVIHLHKRLRHRRPDRAQWMLRRHPRLGRDVAEHPLLLLIRWSLVRTQHGPPLNKENPDRMHGCRHLTGQYISGDRPSNHS